MVNTLLVEDNMVFRMYLREMLSERFPDMSITEAASAYEARAIVNSHCPDLIFMDINLRGENGLTLTRYIKARYPAVVIIILTGYDLPEYRDEAAAAGADHYLVKGSAELEELVELTRKIAEKSVPGHLQ